jgi:HlyD family secretion protein
MAMKRKTWIALGAGALVLVGGGIFLATRGKEEIKWRTSRVERGSVTQKISATGTLNALVSVPVGTQVSGIISSISADYNSLVKKGQVIAQIDPTLLETQLRDAEATLLRSQASYENAKAEFARTKRLADARLVSDQDRDAKETAMKQALGSLQSARASVARAKANLGYCTITAPVDGVVVARLADVGQTVAASFSTPNLFTIAQDLSKMKLEVSIDEADIGQVKAGQPAFFTVDSYPDKQFRGRVAQVRLEATTTSNVVTYKVVMEVENEPLDASSGSGAQASEAGRPGSGLRDLDPAQREALLKRLGFKPEDLRDPAKREELREKMHALRAKSGGTAMAVTQGNATQQKRVPGGINFAAGPVYAGNLALRPGMTANVTIMTNRRDNVLRVPNAALRFNPSAFIKETKKEEAPRAGGLMMMGPPRRDGQRSNQGGNKVSGLVVRREDRIWVLENGKPKAIPVRAGISDGQYTEISGEQLQEGMTILLGVEGNKAAGNGAASGASRR